MYWVVTKNSNSCINNRVSVRNENDYTWDANANINNTIVEIPMVQCAFFLTSELNVISLILVDVKLCHFCPFLENVATLFELKIFLFFNNFGFLLAYRLFKTIAFLELILGFSAVRDQNVHISHWFQWHKQKKRKEDSAGMRKCRFHFSYLPSADKNFFYSRWMSVHCTMWWILDPITTLWIVCRTTLLKSSTMIIFQIEFVRIPNIRSVILFPHSSSWHSYVYPMNSIGLSIIEWLTRASNTHTNYHPISINVPKFEWWFPVK